MTGLRASIVIAAAAVASSLQLRVHPSLPSLRCPAPLLCDAAAVSTDIYGRPTGSDACPDIYGRSSADEDKACTQADPVVKVYTVHSSQHPAMPWANKAQEESTGSGFSIRHDGQLCIVTNAHVVADATYVEVRKAGDAKKYVAVRKKVAHECDLATLHVEDQAFWEGVTPLAFGTMPSLQDEVAVVGYPEGGEGVSITQGVVSRIEIQR